MAKENKLPPFIFVHWDGDSPDQYLAAQKTPRGIDNGVKVGVYQLVETKTQKITEELV